MIAEAADYPGELQVEARFALILVYNREHQHDAAVRVLETLEREHPRNRLIILEKASTMLRGERMSTPSASCPMGSRSSPETAGGGFPAKKPCGATREEPPVSALAGVTKPWRTCVLRSTRAPADWVAGRSRVELGKAAERNGDPNGARSEHRQQAVALCERGNDPACVEDARRRLERVAK